MKLLGFQVTGGPTGQKPYLKSKSLQSQGKKQDGFKVIILCIIGFWNLVGSFSRSQIFTDFGRDTSIHAPKA